jgi:predicted nucleotidyltransferase
MEQHHQATIDRLTETFHDDPRYIALIIGGSVAKGLARPDSDVDFILVAAQEVMSKATRPDELFYFDQEIAAYDGGYVDGKIYDLPFLRELAEHGSEVARSAFIGAWVAFSRDDEIYELVKRIPVYSEAERDAKIKTFYGQLFIVNWFISEAEKRNNKYLLYHATSELVLYGSRLILAYNRILYPYHKWMLNAVSQAKDKPERFEERINELLENPCKETAQAFVDCINDFHDWGVSTDESVIHFMREREWNWRGRRTPLEDW